MEGINKTLFKEIENYIFLLNENKEQELKRELRDFLELDAHNYGARQDLSLTISKNILQKNQKQNLPKIYSSLMKLEKNLKDIQPYQRDHICHSVLTYLLGIVLNIRLNLNIDFFEWKLAGLLHDVGYPPQILEGITKDFLRDFETSVLDEEPSEYKPLAGQHFERYLSLYHKEGMPERNTLELITNRLSEWGIHLDCKDMFNKMSNGESFDLSQKRTDHGIISSTMIMRAVDKKYKENNPQQIGQMENDPVGNNWSFQNFENEITNACSAIFIHNLSLDGQWDYKSTPLAVLLKICDELQDWGRPSHSKPGGESPRDYDFEFRDDKLLFYAKAERLAALRKKLECIDFPIELKELL